MWRALEIIPGSIRSLAHETGVSDVLLRMIRDGERSATLAVVENVAEALERFGARHDEAARILRDALRHDGSDR